MKTCETIRFDIFVAGDFDVAKHICRKFCFSQGECVTLEKVDYIYTGGEEAGIRVGFINYPRFPRDINAIYSRAKSLADELLNGLFQHSYSIVGPNETLWFSRREEN